MITRSLVGLGIVDAVQRMERQLQAASPVHILQRQLEQQASAHLRLLTEHRDRTLRIMANTCLFPDGGISQAHRWLESCIPRRDEPMLNVTASLQASTNGLFGPVSSLIEMQRQLANRVDQWREPFEQISAALANFPSGPLEQLSHIFDNFPSHDWNEYSKIEKQAFALFMRLGISGLELFLTAYGFKEILDVQADQGDDAALSFIFQIFSEDDYMVLNELVSQWQDTPYLADRYRAVTAAIAAHKRGEYELTISTLLPWIDGLSAEIVSRFPNRKRKTIHVCEVVQMYKESESELSSECLVQVVENVLFQDVDLRTMQAIPSSNNRHAILHGRVANFGTELCSYQVILLLNMIVYIFHRIPPPADYAVANSEIAHA